MEDSTMTNVNTRLIIIILAILFLVPGVWAKGKEVKEALDSTDTLKPQLKVVFEWPSNEGWKSTYHVDDEKVKREVFYPSSQSKFGSRESVIVEILPDKYSSGIVSEARLMFLRIENMSPGAEWKILERSGPDEPYSWIIFALRCPANEKTNQPFEDQLWKVMCKGRKGLYYIQYIYQGDDLPQERRDEVREFFGKIKLEEVES